MRKVNGYRQAWPPFRNAFSSSQPNTSPLTALRSEQGFFSLEFSSPQRPGIQLQRKSLTGELEFCLRSLQTRTKCSVEVHFSSSTSRPSSTQSLQIYSPNSVSISGLEQLEFVRFGPVGVAPALNISFLKARRYSSLAGVSDFTEEGKDCATSKVREVNSSISAHTCRAILSKLVRDDLIRSPEGGTGQKDTGDTAFRHWAWNSPTQGTLQEWISLISSGGTDDGREESQEQYHGHAGKATHDGASQITSRRNWNDSRCRDAQRVGRGWSLRFEQELQAFRGHVPGPKLFNNVVANFALTTRSTKTEKVTGMYLAGLIVYSTDATQRVDAASKAPKVVDHSQRAVVVALWCNFLVFSLKVGVWMMTSSHVMLAEAVHSLADLANQGLLAYGLISSRRAPDALHPYGYTKERFVWSLISACGIFCLGAGATIVNGMQNLWSAEPLANVMLAGAVIAGSMLMEGASFVVAYGAVKKGAAAEGMTLREYLWRGHDPTSVAVLMEDGAAVAGLVIAGLALATAELTGNPIWDPIGSILVGNLLGVVAIFLIQRNRQALLGRSIDDVEMRRVINLLIADPVVEGLYDCKSEVIGPGAYRFKAEIDFNGVVIVQNYLQRAGRDTWMREFREAVNNPDGSVLDRVMAEYGEEVVSALGCEVDRLEKDIQRIVPGIRHVDIEAHNPNGPAPREKFYLY